MGKITRVRPFRRLLLQLAFLVLLVNVFLRLRFYHPRFQKGAELEAPASARVAPSTRKLTARDDGISALPPKRKADKPDGSSPNDKAPAVKSVVLLSKNSTTTASVGADLPPRGYSKEEDPVYTTENRSHQDYLSKVPNDSDSHTTAIRSRGKTHKVDKSEESFTGEKMTRSPIQQSRSQIHEFSDGDSLANFSTVFYPRPLPPARNPYIPKYLIQARELCPADGPYVLVVVPSVEDHTKEREFIRTTWGRPAYAYAYANGNGLWPAATEKPTLNNNRSVKLVFFLGERASGGGGGGGGGGGAGGGGRRSAVLEAESKRYGDIVVADFVDSYRNLSLKMGAVLHWSSTFCPGARHLQKVDEDTVVNLPALVRLLEELPSRGYARRFVLGHRHYVDRPRVVRSGHWAVEPDAYPLPYFPRYLYGHCYVISGDVVRDLLRAHSRTPLVPVEDAYLTGILAHSVGALRLHSPRFVPLLPRQSLYDRCDVIVGNDVSQAGLKPMPVMESVWKLFVSGECFRGGRLRR